MKLPKKIKEIIKNCNIDINNFTKQDINYCLKTVFNLSNLDWYKSRNVLLRSAWNNKGFELHMWGDISIEIDIFYIKLFKEWLVDIRLFQLEYDTDTKEWIKLDKFLLKYISNNCEWGEQSISFSWWGNTIIDLKAIIENDYERFMELVLLNLLPWKTKLNEDNWDMVLFVKPPIIWTYFCSQNSLIVSSC